MRRERLFFRCFLAACAAWTAVSAWIVLSPGLRADLPQEGRRTLFLALGTGVLAAVVFFSVLRRMFQARKSIPGSDPGEVAATHPNLVMKVDPEGGILHANEEVERTLYGMGLPPQHAELLLPDDAGEIVRNLLSSEKTVRTLTCETEGRTIEYTVYRFEGENAVVFQGVDVTEEPGEETPERIAGESFAPGTGTVLLIEDEEVVRDVAVAMFTSLGLEVLTAPDGKKGVEVFRREHARITFIVLDLHMPVMDGVRAYEEIRKIDPAAKIVIATGVSEDEDVDRLREQGAAAVLSKPYTYGEIARVAGRFASPVPSPLPVQEP